jgi:Zn-dependent peptidase ImmA (M78 family)
MRIFVTAAIIAGLLVPAYSQTRMDDEQNNNSKADLEKSMEKKKKDAQEIEKAYTETVKKTREQPVVKKTDPWANMR